MGLWRCCYEVISSSSFCGWRKLRFEMLQRWTWLNFSFVVLLLVLLSYVRSCRTIKLTDTIWLQHCWRQKYGAVLWKTTSQSLNKTATNAIGFHPLIQSLSFSKTYAYFWLSLIAWRQSSTVTFSDLVYMCGVFELNYHSTVMNSDEPKRLKPRIKLYKMPVMLALS